MIDDALKDAILNSLKSPVMFVNPQHVICYMNQAAIEHYEGGASLLGTSVLECHNAESQRMIHIIWRDMQDGLDERLITDNANYRIYMRAVRDGNGMLLGYYERYEAPRNDAS